MSSYHRTDQIMRVVAEACVEGLTDRGFNLRDAARAAIETMEDEIMAKADDARVERSPTSYVEGHRDGMERAALLLIEEASSADKLIEEAANKGDSHAKMRLWAIRDAMLAMVSTVRAFKDAGPDDVESNVARLGTDFEADKAWLLRQLAETGDLEEPAACGGVLPSCLCCGDLGKAKVWVIDHPEVYVCEHCHSAASAPVVARQDPLSPEAIIRDSEQGVVCEFTEGRCFRRECRDDDTCKARDAHAPKRRFPEVISHEGHNVVVTLADGAQAVFLPSCDIAIEVAKRLRDSASEVQQQEGI